MKDKLTREQMIELVDGILRGEYNDDEEISRYLKALERSSGSPHVSDLIFYPESGDPTAEEIVDQALAYKPIALGPATNPPDGDTDH